MNDFKTARYWLTNADAIIISASNGLSIAEGYNIFAHDEAFMTRFGAFYERYGIMNILQGVLYNYPTTAERDAFYKVLFAYMIDHYEATPVFQDLKQLVGAHEYFVVTSNGDMHFQLSGFDDQRIFEVEGNFGNNQNPMPMIQKQQAKFKAFVQKYRSQKVVVLELGIGANNQLIKAPLMGLVAQRPSYRYITLNLPHEIKIPTAIAQRSIGLAGSIDDNFKELLKND